MAVDPRQYATRSDTATIAPREDAMSTAETF
jgi:hypothetical protein